MATEGTRSRSSSESPTSGRDGERHEGEGRATKKQGARSKRLSPIAVASAASEQLAAMTGRAPESVTSLERVEDGWKVSVEVVEARRIPDSADILALYEVQVDSNGHLAGYRRVRRYARGRTGDE